MLKLYTHVPERMVVDLAAGSFPAGYVLSPDLDWVVEDAIDEGEFEEEPHVVISIELPKEAVEIDRDDLLEAISDELDVPLEEISQEHFPETFEEALELTQSVELVKPVEAGLGTILGVPFEVMEEDLTPEELGKGTWYRFPNPPVRISELRERFWPGIFRKIFTPKRRR